MYSCKDNNRYCKNDIPIKNTKFKKGNIVYDKLTGEKFMIIETPNCNTEKYKVRYGSYDSYKFISEFEIIKK